MLTVTFGFIRQEFLSYVRCFLPVFIPVFVLTSLANMVFHSSSNIANSMAYGVELTFSGVLNGMIRWGINILYAYFILASTISYIDLYNSGGAVSGSRARLKAFGLFRSFFPAFSLNLILIIIYSISLYLFGVEADSFLQFILTAAFLIPGLIYTIKFSLFFIVVGVEQKGAFAAFKRSLKLMEGNWWKSFWALFIILFVCVVIIWFMDMTLKFIISQVPDDSMSVFVTKLVLFLKYSVNLAAVFLAMVPAAVFIFINYYNLVERKEAPDLMARIEEIASHDNTRPFLGEG